MSDNKSRLLELDVFRGIAALSVVCFHSVAYYADYVNPSAPALPKYFTGLLGVYLFFIISGFVIFMTLEKTKSPMDFIVARFSRLFPGYWVAILLAFISINTFYFMGEGVSVRRTAVNLFMIQKWLGVEHIDGVYWTLSIELAFYVAMFMLFFTKRMKYVEIFGVGWLILMLVYAKIKFRNPDFMDIGNLLRCGHLFFAGIIFYKIKAYGGTWYRYALLALCLLVQFMLRVKIHHGHYLPSAVSTLVVFTFFVFFYLFVTERLSFISLKPLVFLGAISYSLYLTHQSISCPLMQYLYIQSAGLFWVFFIPLCSSLLVATLITFGIEKPAMAYMRNLYKKWQSRRDRGASSIDLCTTKRNKVVNIRSFLQKTKVLILGFLNSIGKEKTNKKGLTWKTTQGEVVQKKTDEKAFERHE